MEFVITNGSFYFCLLLTLCAFVSVPITRCSELTDDRFSPQQAAHNNLHQGEESTQETLGWKGLFKKHLPSLCLTSAVGALTGAVSASIENKQILSWPISWLWLWSTRSVTVNAIIQEMRTYKIPHNKKLAFIGARLADWIVYLFCKAAYGPKTRNYE